MESVKDPGRNALSDTQSKDALVGSTECRAIGRPWQPLYTYRTYAVRFCRGNVGTLDAAGETNRKTLLHIKEYHIRYLREYEQLASRRSTARGRKNHNRAGRHSIIETSNGQDRKKRQERWGGRVASTPFLLLFRCATDGGQIIAS